MCKIVLGNGLVSQAPLRSAIVDIDPECGDDLEDSDLQFLLRNRSARRRCDLCPKKIAKRCDRVHCCMDPEYSGLC